MLRIPARISFPLLAAVGVVGLILSGLLVGYELVESDPETMYRPLKSELARALREGRLPLWSDKLGVGTPLAAESHVAAFYPPNWVLYRGLSVERAYGVSMWLHNVALVAATYLYARALGLTPWGSALAAMAFTLCGFQMSHAKHEPFYHALPYLLLALTITERYLADGRIAWVPALALTIGAQMMVGHFQIQAWTSALVIVTCLVRIVSRDASWKKAPGIALALAWGWAMATVQLALTYELTQWIKFDRPQELLANHSFPPARFAQLALPQLFMAFRRGAWDPYWGRVETSPDEAGLYVGTITLLLAGSGYLARDDRALGLWRWLTPLGFLVAILPRVSPQVFGYLLYLPVFGYFRAPARYLLLPSLGLCLLAGRGFDRAPRESAVLARCLGGGGFRRGGDGVGARLVGAGRGAGIARCEGEGDSFSCGRRLLAGGDRRRCVLAERLASVRGAVPAHGL